MVSLWLGATRKGAKSGSMSGLFGLEEEGSDRKEVH